MPLPVEAAPASGENCHEDEGANAAIRYLADGQIVIHRILLNPIAEGFPTVVGRRKVVAAPDVVEIQAAANQK